VEDEASKLCVGAGRHLPVPPSTSTTAVSAKCRAPSRSTSAKRVKTCARGALRTTCELRSAPSPREAAAILGTRRAGHRR